MRFTTPFITLLAITLIAASLIALTPVTQASFVSGFAKAIQGGQAAGLLDSGFTVVIVNIMDFLLAIVAALALLAIIWGAVMYIMSLGSEQRVARAKSILLYSLFGLAVSGLYKVIASIVWCNFLERAETRVFTCSFASAGEFVNLIIRIVQVMMAPAAAIAFGALVFGGYLYIASGGDEAKINRAKHIILYAFLGLALIGISGILVNAVLAIVIP